MIELRTLGTLDLRTDSDGRKLRELLSRPKRFGLLVYLTLARPRGFHRRDVLFGIFWPEAPHARARAALNQSLYVLRRVLGEDVLITRGDDEVGVNRDVLWCDAIAFDNASIEGRFSEALELCSGELLAGFHLSGTPEFERWLDAERDRFKRDAIEAVTTLAKRERDTGNVAGVTQWLRRATRMAPYDERLLRDLLTALAQVGDISGAILEFEGFRARLTRDLELEPAAETAALVAALRAANGVGEPAGEVIPPHAPGPSASAVAESEATTDRLPRHSVIEASGRRHSSARRVLLLVGAASGIVIMLLLGLGNSRIRSALRLATPAAQPRVIVIPFDNLTGDTLFDPLGRMAADWLTQSLQRTGLVQVIDPHAAWRLRADVDSTDTGRLQTAQLKQVAEAARASTVVWGSVTQQNGQVVLRAQILAAADAKVLRSLEPVLSPSHDVGPGLEVLHQRVAGAVASLIDQRIASEVPASSPPPTYEAYREFADGIDLYLSSGHFMSEGVGAAIEHFERAAALDTTFITARLWSARLLALWAEFPRSDSIIRSLIPLRDRLPPAERAGLDAFVAAINEDAEAELLAIRRAAQLAPQSMWAPMAASAALDLGRPRDALTDLAVFGPSGGWLKNWVGYWTLQMTAYHQLGQYEKQLELARRDIAIAAPDRRPAHGPRPFVAHELYALAALGRLQELERRMDAVAESFLARGWSYNLSNAYLWVGQELNGHGHPQLARQYFERCIELNAQVRVRLECLLEAGRLDHVDVDSFLAARPGGRPNPSWDALAAQVAAKLGRREDALRYQARMEQTWWRKRDTYARLRFQQARIAALLGDRGRAVAYLKQEPHRGSLYEPMHTSRDFERIRNDPFVAGLMRPMK